MNRRIVSSHGKKMKNERLLTLFTQSHDEIVYFFVVKMLVGSKKLWKVVWEFIHHGKKREF